MIMGLSNPVVVGARHNKSCPCYSDAERFSVGCSSLTPGMRRRGVDMRSKGPGTATLCGLHQQIIKGP